MKMLTRYAYQYRLVSTNAGVWAGSASVVWDVKFNLIITGFNVGINSYDSATEQGIESQVYLEMQGYKNMDNPALEPVVAGYKIYPLGVFQNNDPQFYETYMYIPAGSQLTANYSIYLRAVTANIIFNRTAMAVRYECPEDYLSIEGTPLKPL